MIDFPCVCIFASVTSQKYIPRFIAARLHTDKLHFLLLPLLHVMHHYLKNKQQGDLLNAQTFVVVNQNVQLKCQIRMNGKRAKQLFC